MFAPVVWCRCSYDTSSHLHGSWCATTREGGASLPPVTTLTVVARGQHEQHSASDTAQRSSLALAPHDMEGDIEQQDGGARRLVRLLDLAISRGDRLAIATIETRLGFSYGDRFIREA